MRLTCTLVMISLLALSPYVAPCQQFKVSWNDNSKIVDDYDDAILLNNGYYLLSMIDKSKKNRTQSADCWLMLVDANMNFIKETKLSMPDIGVFNQKLYKIGNAAFLLYAIHDKDSKTNYIYATKFDEKTLAASPRMLIGTYDAERYADQVLKFSADSSKIMIYGLAPSLRKENVKFYIGVLDASLKKIWSRSVEIPIEYRFAEIDGKEVTNDGKVFLTVKHYEKEVIHGSLRDQDTKIPPYKYRILSYSKDKLQPRETGIQIDNYFIQSAKLEFRNNGSVGIAGFYKKTSKGNITGTFYGNFDSTDVMVKQIQQVTFPTDFLALIDEDGMGKKSGDDAGLYKHFRIDHIISRNEGKVDLVSEFYLYDIDINSEKHLEQRWVYGDNIIVSLDKNGKAIFTRIPKHQEGAKLNFWMSYYPIVRNDKLILLYNDHEDNMERDLAKDPKHYVGGKEGVFAAALIDGKGNVTRHSIYSYRGEKQLAMPLFTSRVADSQFLIMSGRFSLFGSRTRYGFLDIR